jgi:hypothetical protein
MSLALNYFYAILAAISFLVFVDVLILYKNNNLLKTFFLLFLFGSIFFSVGNIYCNYFGYNRLIIVPIKSLLIFSLAGYISIIFYHKLINWLIFIPLSFVVIQWSGLFYFEFINPKPHYLDLSNQELLGLNRNYLRLIFTSIFFFPVINIYLKIKAKHTNKNIYNIQYFRWALAIISSFGVVIFAQLVSCIYPENSNVVSFLIIIALLANVLTLFYRPRFINKGDLRMSIASSFIKKMDLRFPESTFEELFFFKFYYLDPNASLVHFSELSNISVIDIPIYIERKYKLNFNDLLNKQRVNYFVDLIKKEEYQHLTVDALAQLSGFNSRHHLFKPFQKFHGGTPSALMRTLIVA